MAKKKLAPVGDSMHSPRVQQVQMRPDPAGNRHERREAARVARQQQKKKGCPAAIDPGRLQASGLAEEGPARRSLIPADGAPHHRIHTNGSRRSRPPQRRHRAAHRRLHPLPARHHLAHETELWDA